METVLYLQLNLFSLLICGTLLLHHRKSKIDVIGKVIFDTILVSTCAVVLLDSAAWILEGRIFNGSCHIYKVVLSLNFIVQIIPCMCLFIYCVGLRKRFNKFLKLASFLPLFIGILMVVMNAFSSVVFTIDVNNIYHREGGFYIIGGIPVLYMICALMFCVKYYFTGEKTERKMFLHMTVTLVVVIAGTVIQVLFYGMETIWMMVSIGMVYLYINVQSIRETAVKKELEENRIEIMLSQIQPHFLYNVLASIKMLIALNPSRAEEAVEDFALFLRGNMDSLNSRKLVTFSQEWAHTEHYLKLQKLRFNERLTIKTDFQKKDFLLPPLTLQPIVENAVKYGVGAREEGGTVKITTTAREHGVEIVVENDGSEFNSSDITTLSHQNNGRSHIGLINVRNRVRLLTGGDITISKSPEGGNRVTLWIGEVNEDEYTCSR